AINYGSLTQAEKEREKRTGRKIGKGIATLHKAPAMPSFTATAAVVKMNSDGSVIVNVALTEIGQGSATAVQQIAAERLRFPLSKVKVTIEKDTDKEPYDWQTVASKGIILTGNATALACDELLAKAYGDAAQALRCQTVDLDHDGEKIFIKHRPEQSVSFAQLSVGYAFPNGNAIGGPLIGVGRYVAQGLTNLDKETGQGLPALDWTFGAHGIIAEVDPDSGEYKVIKVASVFDVGKVINPDIVRGQAIGGMIQGLGTAICEGYIYDEAGHLLNPSFTDNKIPTAKDLPEEIESIAVETAQLDGPFGARGVGEHPMISVAPALGNAIRDAVGAELMHMPIRFEDVWRAMRNKEPIDNWITKTPSGSCRSDAATRVHSADRASQP
ncbi:MAG TPA: molybdopterin cofactor-binding domain-containing protein, partial [Rectinemataceae bacterium]|nr:molybdopterin cofactor-binding domain-containing protein [Rectinemataceae bacterium]